MELFTFNDESDASHAENYRPKPVPDEETLRTWLQQNPDLLGETLLIIGRESNFGKGPMDLLALDRFGNTVVVEVKQGDTSTGSTSEDKIIGQPQRYATSVEPLGYGELNSEYSQYVRQWEPERAGEELSDGFKRTFGHGLNSYNHYQRRLIVAERITLDTVETSRLLVQEGVKMQCREVKRFVSPDDTSPVLAGTTVVDYDLSEVRPATHTAATYYDEVMNIIQRAFPTVCDLLEADTVDEIRTGFDGGSPGIKSNNPDHPDSVRYKLYIHPLTWGLVGIGIDVFDRTELQVLRDNEDVFRQHGFAVKDRDRERVVVNKWEMNSRERLEDEDFLEEVAERYTELIKIGHDILTEDNA